MTKIKSITKDIVPKSRREAHNRLGIFCEGMVEDFVQKDFSQDYCMLRGYDCNANNPFNCPVFNRNVIPRGIANGKYSLAQLCEARQKAAQLYR